MRILVTSTSGMGHLNSLLPLMAALQKAGRDVLVVTAAESCDLIERYGFAVRKGGMSGDARRATFEPRMAEAMALPPRQRRGLYFASMFAEAAAPVMRVDLQPAFDEFRPDIVIHERGELASGPMAVARSIPHVTVAFSGTLPKSSEQLVIDTLEPLWAAEGLPVPTMDDINGDLYLHPFPPSFGQAPSSGDVRPMRAEPFERTVDASPPLLASLGDGRPLVYLTSGTEPIAATAPWAAAVEALGAADVDVLATIGRHLDPSLLGDLPPNIRVERFVPQQFVLERAAIVISHAGAGTVLGAAAHGLPQAHFPLRADQWENADAAAGAGVAITLELDRRSAADIGDALARLLHDEQIKRAASRVAAEIAAMPSAADHVATIEAVVNRRASRSNGFRNDSADISD
jgi:UDP:flavonoid glycosyltransferase YjiC (YdhE family)